MKHWKRFSNNSVDTKQKLPISIPGCAPSETFTAHSRKECTLSTHDLLCDQMLTQKIWTFVLLETKSAW